MRLDRPARVGLDAVSMKTELGILLTLVAAICASPAAASDAATIYANRCAFCHGVSGRGDGPAGMALKPPPRNLADAEYWKSADPTAMKAVIAAGKPGTAMVAYGAILSPEEIDALVKHLQSFNPAR
jgi:high-affinity iron transporter